MGVSALGYVEFSSPDLAVWEDFATRILGMSVTKGEQGDLCIRMDQHHHRFRVLEGNEDEVLALGWEVPDGRTLARVAEKLRTAGIDPVAGTPDECRARKVRELVKFVDPNGLPSHIYHGAKLEESAFHPGRGISRFVTENQGLGHAFVYVDDIDRAADFYQDVLGFAVSDYIYWKEMSMDIVFLRCNPRHHSIGFAHHPDVAPGQVEHFMVELESFDDVGRAYDMCQDEGVPIALSLGKHTNDHMQSFYLVTPSGFWLEYGFGGLTIPDGADWQVRHYANGHYWGHKPIAAADHMPKMREQSGK